VKAAGRTKDEVAELVAAIAPRPPPLAMIRKLPERQTLVLVESGPRPAAPPPRPIVPVAEASYKVQFSISREFRDEIREAQDLLRHRIPNGDLATIFRDALAELVAKVKKERFAVGRTPRAAVETSVETESRHVPDAMKRAVHERDGGRCTFVDERGKRCEERGALEIDHVDGFARTHRHDLDSLRLLCRAHNQHTAEQMYGRAFMEAARERTRPGTSSPAGTGLLDR